MRKLQKLWSALEETPILQGVTVSWREAVGEDMGVLAQFLRPLPGLATAYPCPAPGGDGCPRGVVVHGPDDIVAVCRRDPPSCETLHLTRADLVVYELDLRALSDRLRQAMGFTGSRPPAPVDGLPKTFHVGEFRPAPGSSFPVYLTLQYDEETVTEVVERLCGREQRRYVLLTPTASLITPDCRERLSMRRCLPVDLSAFVGADADGHLVADGRVSSVLATLEQRPESQATVTPAESYSEDAHIFKDQGETWLVVFGGIPRSVRNSVGMSYIARMLETPGQEIHAAALRSAVSGNGDPPMLGSAGGLIDDLALKEYHDRLLDIEGELAEAQANNDAGRVGSLTEEREFLYAEVGRATGLRGERREAVDERERARQAVSAAIHRALRAIKSEHEPLWQHLHGFLNIGEFLSYRPDRTTSWIT
ncbi:MAG: hypothetical protein ABIK85_07615 [Candidatus Eisenbacteria bacterium]